MITEERSSIDHRDAPGPQTCPRHPFASSLSPFLSPFGASFTPWIFLQCKQQKVYRISTPLHSVQNFLSNESLFAQIGLRTRELRPFYFGDEICPEISERATLNVFSITPCTCLQIRWFLMCWNVNFMELLDISFSSFLQLWTSSQIVEDSSIHCGIWRGWWFILQLF
jgi:hypothetical protein